MKSIKSISLVLLSLVLAILMTSCEKLFNKPPEISDQQFSVEETSSINTIIGTVVATDKSGQTLTFEIVLGNDDEAFAISQNDGILKVNKTGVLDFETSPSRVISVSVTDEFGKSSTANITINITDVEPTTEGLVLYLPFNENTNDLSINSNNGIDYTAGNYVNGMRGKALDFNGSTDYIQLTSTLDVSEGLTFSFWIKTRGVLEGENNGTIISKYNFVGALRCFHVYSLEPYTTQDDNRLIAYFHNDRYETNANNDMCKSYLETQYLVDNGYNTSLYTLTDPKRLDVNEWTHCVVNLTETDLEIWINGVLRTRKTREYQSYFNSDDCPTYIGNCLGSGSGANNHFNGLIDELRVYNRGLTPEEIQILLTE